MQNALLPVPQDSTETHPPAPSANLTPTDIQRIRQSLDHSVSDNTRKMYASAWRSFQAWAQGRGNLYLPASPQVVAAYLAHQAEERGLSVATIRLHKAALAAVHKTHGHDDPTDHEGVSRIMKGIARTHGRSQRQAKPLTAEALATASTRRPWERQEAGISRESLLARGRVDLALLSVSGTAYSDAQRLICSHGQTWSSRTTGPPFFSCSGPRPTRKAREWCSTSENKPPTR